MWCRRLERPLTVHEHAACLYCFAPEQQIAGHRHEEFCDFRPGRDPVHFGFPPDTSRNLES